mgnify:FL=1
MKKLITTITLLLTIGFLTIYYREIVQFLMIHVIYQDEVLVKEANQYEKNNQWEFVKETDNFKPESKQDILNIFYTALNRGWDELTFYCPDSYKDCLDDVNEITSNQNTLSYVNNFVSTYNSYNKIRVNMNNFGRVNIEIQHIYQSSDIAELQAKVDEIYNEIIQDDMTDSDKVKAAHDYIINHTVYDEERSNEIKSGVVSDRIHTSNTAYGPLFIGKAICGGYTDAMALFLDKIGLPNFKIASENHIWNVVYIDGQWKHLDLTWDDPVVDTGENILTYNYFLISTDDLEKRNEAQHQFDKSIFQEAK